jgi:hypothetical protein
MGMTDDLNQQAQFDRVLGTYDGLPGVRITRPTTVMQVIPIINRTTTAVVQTMRTEDDGVLVFLQVMRGDETVRLVLPDKVAQAIYRQRAALFDRSTPDSRARAKAKRDRERKREEKAARQAAWRAKNPGKKVGQR